PSSSANGKSAPALPTILWRGWWGGGTPRAPRRPRHVTAPKPPATPPTMPGPLLFPASRLLAASPTPPPGAPPPPRPALARAPLPQLAMELADHALHPRARHPAGRHAVNTDAEIAERAGERLGHGPQRALTRRIGQRLRARPRADDAVGVDDAGVPTALKER